MNEAVKPLDPEQDMLHRLRDLEDRLQKAERRADKAEETVFKLSAENKKLNLKVAELKENIAKQIKGRCRDCRWANWGDGPTDIMGWHCGCRHSKNEWASICGSNYCDDINQKSVDKA
jgi:predicted nuclease with TOPRIM domain